jgi:hypothetical protein
MLVIRCTKLPSTCPYPFHFSLYRIIKPDFTLSYNSTPTFNDMGLIKTGVQGAFVLGALKMITDSFEKSGKSRGERCNSYQAPLSRQNHSNEYYAPPLHPHAPSPYYAPPVYQGQQPNTRSNGYSNDYANDGNGGRYSDQKLCL